MSQKDLPLERKKLAEVQAFIDAEIHRLTAIADEGRRRMRAYGKELHTDKPNAGLYNGPNAIEFTEAQHEIEREMVESATAERDAAFLRKTRPAPYFARVDFRTKGADRDTVVYIGLRTLQKPDTFEMIVCDWRAPVSSLFYDEFDGEAFFDAPRGRIACDLLLKRQFRFDEHGLAAYSDSDMKINDEILRDVLSASSGRHLKVIVNSIQREQNRAIRYTGSANLLVTGAAGSGKTSVGFHRLAYLLYRSGRDLTSSEIVMFSNNDVFTSYVADVIPELGEMPINYASFTSLFAAELPTFEVEDYYALAEELIDGDETRRRGAALKCSPAFVKCLEEEAAGFTPAFEDVRYLDRVIIAADELKERFARDVENTVRARAERLCSFAVGRIDEYFSLNAHELFAECDAQSDVDVDTRKLLRKRRLDIKGRAVQSIRAAAYVEPTTVYLHAVDRFAAESGEREALLATLGRMARRSIAFEDAVCLLYLKTLLGTAASLTGVKHVLIDEAQDLSLLQHRVLRRVFPQAAFTLLADGNQAILPAVNTVDPDDLCALYEADRLTLDRSYRSTAPINALALSLLPADRRYEVFERDGDPVKTVDADGLIAEIARLTEHSRSVCLVTRTVARAREVYRDLRDAIPDLKLCDEKDCSLSDNPTVMPLALTKGLEFDSVLVDARDGDFDGDENRHYLYMAVTRALHRLTIIR